MLFLEISLRNKWQGQAMHICKVITEKERSLLADRLKHVFKQDICDNSNRIHVRSFVIVVKTEHAREYKGSPSVAFLCADLLWRGIVCEQERVLRVRDGSFCCMSVTYDGSVLLWLRYYKQAITYVLLTLSECQ